jgi:hypothetical protein
LKTRTILEATGKQLKKPWKLETLPVKTLERNSFKEHGKYFRVKP